MWVYDRLSMKFLDVNKAALREYGYSRDEFLSLNIFDIRPENDVPLPLDLLRRQRGVQHHVGENLDRHARGSRRQVDVIDRPVKARVRVDVAAMGLD